MGQAIGQVLPLGVAVAISPVPIIGVILMLTTARARTNGPLFLLGWVGGLAVLGTVVLLLSSDAGATENGTPARWVGVLKLVLGCLLLLAAARQWRGRPRGDERTELPSWMQTIDRFNSAEAFGLGGLLSALNPKNGVITIAAAAAISQTGAGAVSQAVALAVFIIVATVGVGAPVVIFFGFGDRSSQLLAELKNFMSAHNAVIMAVLLLVIGVKLVGDGIAGLT